MVRSGVLPKFWNMKIRIVWACLFFVLTASPFVAKCQDADSVLLVDADWKTTKIRKGIVWKQVNIEGLFGSKQEINYVEIDLRRNAKNLRLAGVSTGFRRTSEFATENDAVVGINAGFFDTKAGGGVDFIKIDGAVVNETRNENVRANALFLFGKRGKGARVVSARHIGDLGSHPNMLLSGPLLLEDGETVTLGQNPFNNNRHPRSAVAIRGKKLILLTVDGRNAQAQGMSLPELAKVFLWLEMEDAMNLDGGGSTTLFIKGQTPNGIVNHPSDNALFDHQGERKVANAILIK